MIRQSKNYYLLIRSINLRYFTKGYGFHIHVHRKHIIMVILVFFLNSFCEVYGEICKLPTAPRGQEPFLNGSLESFSINNSFD